MARQHGLRLIAGSANGSEQSIPTWEEIARDHGRFMYTVAYRLCGRHDEAEDLVQIALVRVQRGLDRYEPRNLRGWLSRITTNVFLDETRRKKRQPVQSLPEDPERVLAGAPPADEASAAADLPAYIQNAIRSLPEDYRAALVLCDVVGMTYPEISEALDVPIGTVRSRIHRARSSMRDLLQPYLVDQDLES